MAINEEVVDEASLPYVMPTSVPRVTAEGKPTTHLINWEESTRNWYLTNATALDRRVTEVRAEAEGNLAFYKEEVNAIIGPEGSLIEQVTDLEAKSGNATANGQIYFAAKAGPSGSAAAYGLYLTAGSAYTGFEAIAMSDGTSAIGLTASKFVFTDSGAAKEVFTYTGGKFTLTGDVSINGGLVVNGTIVTDKIEDNAISNYGSGQAQSGNNDDATASAPVYARSGDRILVLVTVLANGDTVTTPSGHEVWLNGNTGAAQVLPTQRHLRAFISRTSDTTEDQSFYQWTNATYQFFFTSPSTGTQTVNVRGGRNMTLKVSAQSFSK